ncbi:FtsX-like permease family protein [Herpetosiphon giganteus]|uniref:FtsX-like permease family protein n=1 Tax=Herpetosiphon giganteus TaxID=2029754 RepID=UPI001956EE51|nr:FtsX-like permease family protein [Herpetosiphon giganteus]MBM7845957.1 putative ABC transport system permease protein [Herpetosiphon giganteus]
MRSLNRKILADLRAHRGIFLAVWLTIIIGVAFYEGNYAAVLSGDETMNASYRNHNFMDTSISLGGLTDRQIADQVAAVAGVKQVDGRLIVDTSLQLNDQQLELRLHSLSQASNAPVNSLRIHQGREIQAADEVLLLEAFATINKIAPGDTISVSFPGAQPIKLKVAGLVYSNEYLIGAKDRAQPLPLPSLIGFGYMRYDDLIAQSGIPAGQINSIVLTLNDGITTDAVRSQIQAIVGGLALIQDRLETPSAAWWDTQSKANSKASIQFALLFELVSALATAILLARIVEAEQRQIGTMRALGLSRIRVGLHYLKYGALLGVSGAIVGAIVGYGMSYGIGLFYIKMILQGSFPPFLNSPKWGVIAVGMGIAAGIATLAGAWAAWRAASIEPGIALRPAVPKTVRVSGLLALGKMFPLSIRQALRNIIRVPLRSLATIVGVGLGSVIMLLALGMGVTINDNVDTYVNTPQYDLSAQFAQPMPAEQLRSLSSSVPATSQVGLVLRIPMQLVGADKTSDVVVTGIDPDYAWYKHTIIDGSNLFSNPDQAWISQVMATAWKLKPGDQVTLELQDKHLNVTIGGVYKSLMGQTMIVERSKLAQAIAGSDLANALFINSSNINQTQTALKQLPGVAGIEPVAVINTDLRSFFALTLNLSYIYLMSGGTLVLAVLFNTVTINLRERQEELAIMRSLGTQRKEITSIIILELLITTSLGLIIGSFGGKQYLASLFGVYTNDYQQFSPSLLPISYGILVTLCFGIVVGASLLGLRGTWKQDLGSVSKSISI